MSVVTLSHGKGSGDVTNTIDCGATELTGKAVTEGRFFFLAFYRVVFLFFLLYVV
jgi:hypothetical protein